MTLIFNEQFEATGYDETSAGIGSDWTETNAGGGTLDKDFAVSSVESATGLSLPTWGSQCLKLAGGTSEVSIRNTFDSAKTELYVRVDLIVGDISDLPNGSDEVVFYLWDDPYTTCSVFVRKTAGGTPYMFGKVENSGGDIYFPSGQNHPFAINTKYRVDFHFVANGTCEMKINGVSQGTGASTSANVTRIYIHKGIATYQNTVVYFDNIQLATDGWVPDDTSLDQHSFRFFNDDGDEDASTVKGDLNANVTIAANSTVRIRTLINATGDAASAQYQLEYRYKPSGGAFGGWTKVS